MSFTTYFMPALSKSKENQTETNPNALDFRRSCFDGIDENGNVKIQDNECCADAKINSMGIQTKCFSWRGGIQAILPL